MGSLSLAHWGIVLAIVLLIFGTKKLRSIGSDLGGAVRGFKQGMADSGDAGAPEPITTRHIADATSDRAA